ncbi:MAG: 30S ribosomal protein S20 [Candidatus Wildermuthbacteria bacterium RIFCSPLOWO2_01_FULL_47_18]|uniref:Small ribosomal subunit protein bS20 n=2 Tax=Candidatus Wildermuthiibacteriota TaxID=1817923 RepID=A0A1G2RHX9_9BACT|nr:MAG: 30S ribosomal protein S20 [Candidatus Wildermuthbacteria bacterium RIFCSPHIGHO2_02_FULL_48_16]OHA71969.1 MAG: 30S ribosomal protein S20 [Candidatus Wildermuthbacteria bacterium RIFCSPLOWO2_01_FULL_47_18]
MPITSSAKKALRQGLKKRIQNTKVKKASRALLKKFRALVLQKDKSGAKDLLPSLQKALDKAAKTGTLKKNTASRLKSRVAKSLASLS